MDEITHVDSYGGARAEDWRDVAETFWDAAIVGAGPAGGLAAALLAGRGWRVVLIEQGTWPREKVCGGCLNALGVQTLQEAGLEGALRGGQRIESVAWHVGRRRLELMAGGVALLRSELDGGIVAGAVQRGCVFVSGTTAALRPWQDHAAWRDLTLRRGAESVRVRAGVVLACDGIGGTLLEDEPWAQWHVDQHSWMGVAGTLDAPACKCSAGTIDMYIGDGGYVGMVRLADGRIHLAAALNPAVCRRAGGPGRVAECIAGSCGATLGDDWRRVKLRGTGWLTRHRRQLGGQRVLAVGDACGYVEPFTGEGMAWALGAARLAVGMLPGPGETWPGDLANRWGRCERSTIGRAQRWCRALRVVMHHRSLAAAAVAAGRAVPAAGAFVASCLSEPRPFLSDTR